MDADLAIASRAAAATSRARFEGVRRIAVLRGGGIGDLLFAVPAMQSLAAAYPEAEVTVLAAPGPATLLQDRPGSPHRIAPLPAIPGLTASPGAAVDPAVIDGFVERMREERFDLGVQVHGGGRYSNPFLLRLGARHTVGTRTPDAAPLERTLDYAYYQHEVLRALEVVGLAGAPPVALAPHIPLLDAEREAGRAVCGTDRPVVVVHPGASDPRRRWPAERFVEVIRRLVATGVRVVLVGGPEDVELCGGILSAVRRVAVGAEAGLVTTVAGRLTLPALAGVLAAADVVLANDSGPRHLAEAVGSRTVSVYWFGNLVNAGPLGRGRHRVHLSWVTRCPVCGRDVTQVGWTSERCEHDVSFVGEIAAGPVYDDVIALLDAAHARHEAPPRIRRGRPPGRQGQDGSSSGQTTSSRTSQP